MLAILTKILSSCKAYQPQQFLAWQEIPNCIIVSPFILGVTKSCLIRSKASSVGTYYTFLWTLRQLTMGDQAIDPRDEHDIAIP